MRISNISLITLLCAGVMVAEAHAETDRSIALILDASGSMKAALTDGKTRMEAAKTAVAEFVTGLAADTRLALFAPTGTSRRRRRRTARTPAC